MWEMIVFCCIVFLFIIFCNRKKDNPNDDEPLYDYYTSTAHIIPKF